jgi:hypothetical protein
VRAEGPVCFRLPIGESAPSSGPGLALRLRDVHQEALADLLQILACGEESAVLAFKSLSRSRPSTAAQQALTQVASEELIHERLLRGLRSALPTPTPDPELRRTLRHFYRGVECDDAGFHFANIAALDSAVCVILTALLAPGRVLVREPAVAGLFARIRRDEARHVRLSREFVPRLVGADAALAMARRTRLRLVELLARRTDAIAALEVDPAPLFRRLSTLPAGLLG